MSDETIHGSTSNFELMFHKALEAAKDVTGGRVFHINFGRQTYTFTASGDVRGHLPRRFTIVGPTLLSRYGSPGPLGHLGWIDIATGKHDYSGHNSATAKRTENVVHSFLHQHGGIHPEQLGWDIIYRDGYAFVLKRTSTDISKGKKEIALVAAEYPGQRLRFYAPDGKRRLTYEEQQKTKMPSAIIQAIHDRFKNDGVWHHLSDSYNAVKRRVSSWEDGPGEKYEWPPLEKGAL
jgi:hypothetical protein